MLFSQARLLAGRGLAYEGIGDWKAAVADYDRALETARASDLKPDPYVLNSRANALGSLGRWSGAAPAGLCSAHLTLYAAAVPPEH